MLKKPLPLPDIHQIRHLHGRVGRFRFLTVVMVAMIALRPFLGGFFALGLVTDVLFLLVFFSGVYAVKGEKGAYRLGWVLALTFAALRVLDLFGWLARVGPFEKALVLLFLLLTLHNIYRQIQAEERVTMDLIFAACCSYLLIGMVWAHAYYFLEWLQPGSLKGLEPAAGDDISEFTYYSFVTLTTMGYGDILPVTKQARSLAILEAVTGQLYIAILVGRLVGAYVGEPREDQ